MLEALQEIFGEELPLDDALEQRLRWAQAVGLLYFYTARSDGWSGEEREPEEVRVGISKALPYLASILLSAGGSGDLPLRLNLLMDAFIQVGRARPRLCITKYSPAPLGTNNSGREHRGQRAPRGRRPYCIH